MKPVLFTLFFTLSALAQNPAPARSACGPDNVKFNVHLDRSHTSPTKIEAGRAQFVFIQDFGSWKLGLGMHVVTRIGIDGSWVGATKDNGYFSIPIKPGEHHLCVNLDSQMLGNPVEFAHFNTEAGKVYYFRSRYMEGGNLLVSPVDRDEAEYQMGVFPQSESSPRK